MVNRVLVAFATKYGATRDIAVHIGEVLTNAGVEVDVLQVDEVERVDAYSAVILGSAVYAGQWRKEAVTFLVDNETELTVRPVWIFSTGPTGDEDPITAMKGWRFPEAQQAVADRIKPRDITLFHGAIDTQRLNFAERLIIKGMKVATGDYRNWDMITNWARTIADQLVKNRA